MSRSSRPSPLANPYALVDEPDAPASVRRVLAVGVLGLGSAALFAGTASAEEIEPDWSSDHWTTQVFDTAPPETAAQPHDTAVDPGTAQPDLPPQPDVPPPDLPQPGIQPQVSPPQVSPPQVSPPQVSPPQVSPPQPEISQPQPEIPQPQPQPEVPQPPPEVPQPGIPQPQPGISQPDIALHQLDILQLESEIPQPEILQPPLEIPPPGIPQLQPDSPQPENPQPQPEIVQPGVVQPDIPQPQPEIVQPETPQPENPQAQPEIAQPGVVQPGVVQPDIPQPQPEILQPETPQPENPQPQPEIAQPDTPQPEIPQPETPQPEIPQPDISQPEILQPQQTIAPQPQPDAPQPDIPQPEPEIAQPEVPQAENPQPQPLLPQPELIAPQELLLPVPGLPDPGQPEPPEPLLPGPLLPEQPAAELLPSVEASGVGMGPTPWPQVPPVSPAFSTSPAWPPAVPAGAGRPGTDGVSWEGLGGGPLAVAPEVVLPQAAAEPPRPPAVTPLLSTGVTADDSTRFWPGQAPASPASTAVTSLPPGGRTESPASVDPRLRTPVVVQVDFQPNVGDDVGEGTGVVLDRSSVSPALQAADVPEDETAYVLTVKHGLPNDIYAEAIQAIDGITVLIPRRADAAEAQPIGGRVVGARVSGSSDLALLVVRGNRAALGPLAGPHDLRVAAADQPIGTPVSYIGVNPSGQAVTASGRITEGPTSVAFGDDTGPRWGDPVGTDIPPQIPGNSGGPLFNQDGEVIGVLVGKGANGRSYFVSIGDLRRFLQDARDSVYVGVPSWGVRVLFPRTFPDQPIRW